MIKFNLRRFFLVYFFSTTLVSLNLKAQENLNNKCHVKHQSISIMSYNLQNLFDVQHDPNFNDYTYLPKTHELKALGCAQHSFNNKQCLDTDWSEQKLDEKINKLAAVILNIAKAPDIIAVVEFENEKILDRLSKKIGYQNFFLNDNKPDEDERGIRTGLLIKDTTKFTPLERLSHPVEYIDLGGKKRKLRQILEIRGQLGPQKVSFFVNHWAAQMSPFSYRVAAAEVLLKAITNANQKGYSVFSMGDYNNRTDSTQNAFDVFAQATQKILNLHEETKLFLKEKLTQPEGTYFYKKEKKWNLYDLVLYNVEDREVLSPNLESYKIITDPSMGQFIDVDEETILVPTSPSDHFPVYFEICY